MTFILTLEKAQKSPRLVPEKRTVTRDGTTFQMTVWVDPKAKGAAGPVQGGFDFDDGEPTANAAQDSTAETWDRLKRIEQGFYAAMKGHDAIKILHPVLNDVVYEAHNNFAKLPPARINQLLDEAQAALDGLGNKLKSVPDSTAPYQKIQSELEGLSSEELAKMVADRGWEDGKLTLAVLQNPGQLKDPVKVRSHLQSQYDLNDKDHAGVLDNRPEVTRACIAFQVLRSRAMGAVDALIAQRKAEEADNRKARAEGRAAALAGSVSNDHGGAWRVKPEDPRTIEYMGPRGKTWEYMGRAGTSDAAKLKIHDLVDRDNDAIRLLADSGMDDLAVKHGTAHSPFSTLEVFNRVKGLVDARNIGALVSQLHSGNKLSRAVFEKYAGQSLGGNSAGIRSAMVAKFGADEVEQWESQERNRRADAERLRAEQAHADLKRRLERVHYRMRDGSVKNAREYIDDIVAQGFTRLTESKRGAIKELTAWSDAAGHGHSFKGRDEKDYLRSLLGEEKK